MMKNIYIFFLLLFLAGAAVAQTDDLNGLSLSSLRQKLTEKPGNIQKIKLQLALGRLLLDNPEAPAADIDSATAIALRSLSASQLIKYNDGVIMSMLLRAQCLQKNKQVPTGLKLAQQALALSQKLTNDMGIAESYLIIGKFYDHANVAGLSERTSYSNKAIAIFRKTRSMRRLAATLKDHAELLFLARQKTEAIKILFEALNIYKAIGNEQVQAVYWLIARTSNEFGDFTAALKYNLLAVKTAEKARDTSLLLCSIYHNTAVTYVNMRDFNRALPYSLKALRIAKSYNSAAYIGTVSLHLSISYTQTNHLQKALEVLKNIQIDSTNYQDRLILSSNILINLVFAKQFQRAEFYATEMIALLKKVPEDDYARRVPSYKYLADLYLKTRQIERAYFYTDLYADLAKKFQFAPGIRTTEENYYRLDSIQGKFKSAMNHYFAAQKIKDSVENLTKSYQISLLQIENDTQKKIEDIDELTKQSLKKDIELKRNRLVQQAIVVGAALLLVIALLLLSRYRIKQRGNASLQIQKTEIERQNKVLQHLNQDKDQLLIDKDELLSEKDLLLKEVNHRVKNNLQIVMSLLQSQSGYLQNKQAQEAILEGQNRVKSIALIHEQLFRTDNTTQIELMPYITELMRSLDRSFNKSINKISIRHDIDAITLDVSQAIPVGIILNEAVTNAFKYAFPDDIGGEISVIAKEYGRDVKICINDTGIGLSPGPIEEKAGGLGLTLIRGLSAQLNGSLDITGDGGVKIRITFSPMINNAIDLSI